MIRTEARGEVGIITIDRPDRRNAVDHETLQDLLAAIAEVPGRVLVLRGAGGHFCAGADLQGVEDESFAALLHRVLVSLRASPRPVMAAVEGAALGAGTQLAIACDLRCATPEALFGVPAGRLGLMVDQWTIDRLASLVGQSMAAGFLLTVDRCRGDRAHHLGLVQRLGDESGALGWADEISRLAPLTLRGHKLGLNAIAAQQPTDLAFDRAFKEAWASRDLQEGLAAFRERRDPDFLGE